ncbi:hypothetical protein ISS08_01490 [Candidatus Pacearchaeota archaeon]|nr:hypothetical protein [Candidatus Pacearchaeota archaeon]
MAKRNKLEIMKDVLELVSQNHNSIKPTPLLRKSNISSSRFKQYYQEILKKALIREILDRKNNKTISLTEKGFRFLEKYQTIVHFIDEFEL